MVSSTCSADMPGCTCSSAASSDDMAALQFLALETGGSEPGEENDGDETSEHGHGDCRFRR